jgi:hypothetical protein
MAKRNQNVLSTMFPLGTHLSRAAWGLQVLLDVGQIRNTLTVGHEQWVLQMGDRSTYV